MPYQVASALQEIVSPDGLRDYANQKSVEIAITPEELRQITFRKSMRGYNPFDVDSVIQRASLALEELMLQRQEVERLTRDGADNARLRADMRAVEQKLVVSENENAGLRSQIDSLKRQLAPLRQELADVQKHTEDSGKLMRQIEVVENERDSLKTEIICLKNQAAELQQSLEDSRTAALETANALKELQDMQVSLHSPAPAPAAVAEDLQKAISLIESAVLNAREVFTREADNVLGAARAKAAEITASAENEAAAVLAGAKEEAAHLHAEALSAKEKADQRIREYRNTLEAHLRAISS